MGVPFLSGVNLVVMLQTLGWLEAPMRFFTFLGSENFFMFVLPVLYWCIDATLGIRIAVILLFSDVVNGIAKLALQGPRPYWTSTQVRALAAESSFGVPSGHAQDATTIWGTAAAGLNRRVAWWLAGVIIFLIGLSRIYLAVHFPLDVLVGWMFGGLILWGFLALWQRVSAWVTQRSLLKQLLLALAAPALLLLIAGLIRASLSGYVIDPVWVRNAARAGDPLPSPLSLDGTLIDTGTLLGLSLGLIWTYQRGGFQPSGPVWKRLECFAVGIAGVAVLYFGLKAVLPAGESLIAGAARFVRYAFIGLWISGGAPQAFARLHLIERRTKSPEPGRRSTVA